MHNDWLTRASGRSDLAIGGSSASPGANRQAIFLWTNQAEDPEAVTLSCGLSFYDGTPYPSGNFDAYAFVSWGLGKSLLACEIDLVRGFTVALFAATVSVDVVYARTAPDHGGQRPPERATFHAHVLPGTGSAGRAQRTVLASASLEAGETSLAAAVPAFAKSVSVYGGAIDTPGGLVVAFYADPIAAPLAVASVGTSPIVLPNGARWFRVKNTNGVSAAAVRAVFELNL